MRAGGKASEGMECRSRVRATARGAKEGGEERKGVCEGGLHGRGLVGSQEMQIQGESKISEEREGVGERERMVVGSLQGVERGR